MTYKFKILNIHLFVLLAAIIAVPLTILILMESFSIETSFSLIAVVILLFYTASLLFVNKLIIYENRIEIFFPLRIIFFKRFSKVIIPFNEVTLVKLICKNAKEPSTIKFFCKPRRHLLYKEYPVYNFSKRKSILLYLKAKGINVEVDSVRKRDNQLLKDDFSYRVSNKD